MARRTAPEELERAVDEAPEPAEPRPPAVEAVDGAPRHLSARRLLRPLTIFAASRVAVVAAMWLTTRVIPGSAQDAVYLAWDATHYARIIDSGYAPDPIRPQPTFIFAFFPLFPLVARGVAWLPGISVTAAGLIVVTLAGAATAVLLWVLADRLMGEAAADRAVAFFCFFPGSFVLSMLYAEALMLALSVACLLALVSRQWWLAGVLAALGTASRPNAVALIAACAWASAVAIRRHGDWRSLVAPALAPAGIAAYFCFLWLRTGDPLTYFTVQREIWNERVTPSAVWDDVGIFLASPFQNENTTAVVFGTVVSLVGLVLLLRTRLPSVLVVYSVVVVALAAGSETLGTRPRFVMTAFPLFLALAFHVRGVLATAVVAASATVLGAFTLVSLSTSLFTP